VTRLVALLRGINVGKAKRIAMADLRELMESLGYTDVRTLLNSGNVVFSAAKGAPAGHAKKIRDGIESQLGVGCSVVVKTAADIASVIAEHPLKKAADDPSRLLVLFTQSDSSLAALAAHATQDWSPEAFAIGKHAVYLWCANGIIESLLAKAVVRTAGEHGTTRNWATVEKLHALAQQAG
jgi:uncharacterized protein (DUF1697 family)